MTDTAKLFMDGYSQAIRLPDEYQFDGDEVFIRRDPKTNDVIISRKPTSWDDFFTLLESIDIPDDFMTDRDNETPQRTFKN